MKIGRAFTDLKLAHGMAGFMLKIHQFDQKTMSGGAIWEKEWRSKYFGRGKIAKKPLFHFMTERTIFGRGEPGKTWTGEAEQRTGVGKIKPCERVAPKRETFPDEARDGGGSNEGNYFPNSPPLPQIFGGNKNPKSESKG